MPQTTEQFFEDNKQEDGTLSPEAMAALLLGDDTNGETLNTIKEDGEQPAPVVEDDDEPVDPEPEPVVPEEEKPVIMAKDGIHTIEYEKLEEAREERKLYKQEAESLKGENASLQETIDALTAAEEDPTDDTATQEAVEALTNLQEQDPDVYKAVQAMLEAKDQTFAEKLADLEDRFAKVIEPIQQSTEETFEDRHFDAVTDVHEDLHEIMVEGGPVDEWVAKQPVFMQTAMNEVITNGDAQEVIDLVNQYKDSLPVEPSVEIPEPDIAAKAAEAVEAVKQNKSVPNSLSAVPAGTKAHHDENEALLNMSNQNQLAKFSNMGSADILEKMSRVL